MPRGVQRVRVVERQDAERIRAARAFQRAADRVLERRRAGLEFRLDQMGDDFRVGLGLELVALGFQLEDEARGNSR